MKIPLFHAKSEEPFAQFLQTLHHSLRGDGKPWLIGIGGPGGTGKSILTGYLQTQLGNCAVLTLDDFRLPRDQRPAHAPFGSHPDAVDLKRLQTVLQSARDGGELHQLHFDRQAGRVLHESVLPAAEMILVDGEITAYDFMAPYLDHMILVQSGLLTQFRSRLSRDRQDRNCSLMKTLRIFIRSNLMDHPRFASNAKARAACILYRQQNNRFRLLKAQL
jgi:uridine kinase